MIFAAFNGVAFIHMFLTAPETKGKSLEEMDDVFDSGLPAWIPVPKGSRLDEIEKEIEAGNLKVIAPTGGASNASDDKSSMYGTAAHFEQPGTAYTVTINHG